MHAEALPPQRQPEEKWGLPIALALGVHLLLALIDDPDASAVMTACNVDLGALKAALGSYVDTDLAALATAGAIRRIRR